MGVGVGSRVFSEATLEEEEETGISVGAVATVAVDKRSARARRKSSSKASGLTLRGHGSHSCWSMV